MVRRMLRMELCVPEPWRVSLRSYLKTQGVYDALTSCLKINGIIDWHVHGSYLMLCEIRSFNIDWRWWVEILQYHIWFCVQIFVNKWFEEVKFVQILSGKTNLYKTFNRKIPFICKSTFFTFLNHWISVTIKRKQKQKPSINCVQTNEKGKSLDQGLSSLFFTRVKLPLHNYTNLISIWIHKSFTTDICLSRMKSIRYCSVVQALLWTLCSAQGIHKDFFPWVARFHLSAIPKWEFRDINIDGTNSDPVLFIWHPRLLHDEYLRSYYTLNNNLSCTYPKTQVWAGRHVNVP